MYINAGAKVTIDGVGTLDADCGIYVLGTLIINNGVINATGDGIFAGIGGSDFVLVEINGGNVTAIGGNQASTYDGGGAGIGGTNSASITGKIKINGGIIYAKGGVGAAGIGGGGFYTYNDCAPATNAPNIYISELANVTAINGGYDAEDIGNGGYSC